MINDKPIKKKRLKLKTIQIECLNQLEEIYKSNKMEQKHTEHYRK